MIRVRVEGRVGIGIGIGVMVRVRAWSSILDVIFSNLLQGGVHLAKTFAVPGSASALSLPPPSCFNTTSPPSLVYLLIDLV